MATVTSFTAARMEAIEESAIVGGSISGDNLMLTRYDGNEINAGNVRGPIGLTGPAASAEVSPFADTLSRFVATNVAAALYELMNPIGTFIMGGWSTDPVGYLILDGRLIVGGATANPTLAGMYPSWVDDNNLLLPDTAGVVPMGGATPGVVSGSMTHTLTSVNQLPSHAHSGPNHQHDIRHGHADNISATSGGSNQDIVRRLTAGGTGGFWTGRDSSPADGFLDYNSAGRIGADQVIAGMSVDYTTTHQHAITINGGVTSAPAGTLSLLAGTGDTGPVGASASINHTPRNMTVRYAVKL